MERKLIQDVHEAAKKRGKKRCREEIKSAIEIARRLEDKQLKQHVQDHGHIDNVTEEIDLYFPDWLQRRCRLGKEQARHLSKLRWQLDKERRENKARQLQHERQLRLDPWPDHAWLHGIGRVPQPLLPNPIQLEYY